MLVGAVLVSWTHVDEISRSHTSRHRDADPLVRIERRLRSADEDESVAGVQAGGHANVVAAAAVDDALKMLHAASSVVVGRCAEPIA